MANTLVYETRNEKKNVYKSVKEKWKTEQNDLNILGVTSLGDLSYRNIENEKKIE